MHVYWVWTRVSETGARIESARVACGVRARDAHLLHERRRRHLSRLNDGAHTLRVKVAASIEEKGVRRVLDRLGEREGVLEDVVDVRRCVLVGAIVRAPRLQAIAIGWHVDWCEVVGLRVYCVG